MHSGYLLLYLSAAWMSGIALAHSAWGLHVLRCDNPTKLVWAAAVTLMACAYAMSRRLRLDAASLTILLLLSATLGAWRYSTHPQSPCLGPKDVAFYDQKSPITIHGVVTSYPDIRDTSARYTLAATKVESGGHIYSVRGKVLVTTRPNVRLHYGDEVKARGILSRPESGPGFDYRAYLARKGIYAVMQRAGAEKTGEGKGSPFWRIIYRAREFSQKEIARLMPEPEGSFLMGILLGIESNIPRELYDQFNRTGTSHIIVISGFNITIVAGLLLLVFKQLMDTTPSTIAAIAGIALYTLFVGADPPVVRAAFMGMIYVLAVALGRQSTAVISLFFSGFLMTLMNPLTLWDLGFQLSFAATLSLVLFTPGITEWTDKRLRKFLPPTLSRKALVFLNDAIIVTTAAQILTIPLIAHTFHRVSLVSLPTNFLILPVQPYIMIGGAAALGASLVSGALGKLAAAVPWFFLHYTIWSVREMASLPFAAASMPPIPAWWLYAYYGAIGVAIAWPEKAKETAAKALQRAKSRLSLSSAIVGLLLLDVVLWQTGGPAPDGLLHVTFLNVGDGDAVLIRTPSGQTVLVNGGPAPSALLNGLSAHLSFWDRSVDGLLVTQGDNAHMDGLRELPGRYRVKQVFVPPGVAAEARWKVWVGENRLPTPKMVPPGARLVLSDNVVIDAMGGVEDVLLWRVTWGKVCFLLPGPMKPSEEKAMVRKWGREMQCQVLLAPDMGRKGSSTEEFVKQVSPRYVVFSIGKKSRRYHRPDADIVLRYEKARARIWYTDRQGEVEFVSDGHDVWLRNGGTPAR